MVFQRLHLAWFCIFLLIVGCKTPKVLPSAYLLTANTFDKCMQTLREGLHSDEFWPSINSAEALIDAGYRFEATPVLHEKLKTEREDVYKAGIAKALLKSGQEDAIVILQDIMLGNNDAAQIETLKGLFYEVSIADTSLVGGLIRTTRNEELHLYASALLHITENQNNIDLIRSKISSLDPKIRIAALDVIPYVGSSDRDTTEIISTLANAPTELEQFHALRALAMLDHAPSRERIPQFINHTDPSIRSSAVFALAESWLVEDANLIYPLLDDPSLSVRVRAAQALLTMNNSASIYRYLRIR